MNTTETLTRRTPTQRAKAINDVYREGLREMRRYLELDKFRHDTTVQVGDILLRINEIETAASAEENI